MLSARMTPDAAHCRQIASGDSRTALQDDWMPAASALTQAPSGSIWTFAVSPAQTLAFVRSERGGIGDVYVVPLTGGEVRRRTRWNANISRVAWMPGGKEILYSVQEAPGLEPSLFRVPADGMAPEPGIRAFHASVGGPSISRQRPSGLARIAFARDRVDVAFGS